MPRRGSMSREAAPSARSRTTECPCRGRQFHVRLARVERSSARPPERGGAIVHGKPYWAPSSSRGRSNRAGPDGHEASTALTGTRTKMERAEGQGPPALEVRGERQRPVITWSPARARPPVEAERRPRAPGPNELTRWALCALERSALAVVTPTPDARFPTPGKSIQQSQDGDALLGLGHIAACQPARPQPRPLPAAMPRPTAT